MNIEEGFVGQAIERCGDRLGYFHVGESHRGLSRDGRSTYHAPSAASPASATTARSRSSPSLLRCGRPGALQHAGRLAQPLVRRLRSCPPREGVQEAQRLAAKHAGASRWHDLRRRRRHLGRQAVLADDGSAPLAVTESPLAISRPRPLWSEQDPDGCGSDRRGSAQLRGDQPAAFASVQAIGLSGQMHAAVLLDAADRPLRPAILWNDGRAHAECRLLGGARADLGRIAGVVPAMPGFTAPKLFPGSPRTSPRSAARTARLVLPKDTCAFTSRASTRPTCDDGHCCFDQARRDWSPELLAARDLRGAATPAEGSAPARALRPGWRPNLARRWHPGRRRRRRRGGRSDRHRRGRGRRRPSSLGTSAQYFVTTASYRLYPEALIHASARPAGALGPDGGPPQRRELARLGGVPPWANGPRRSVGPWPRPSGTGPSRSLAPALPRRRAHAARDDPHVRGVLFGVDADTTPVGPRPGCSRGRSSPAGKQDRLAAAGTCRADLARRRRRRPQPLRDAHPRHGARPPRHPLRRWRARSRLGAARPARLALTGEAPAEVCGKPAVAAVIEPDGWAGARLPRTGRSVPATVPRVLRPEFAAAQPSIAANGPTPGGTARRKGPPRGTAPSAKRWCRRSSVDVIAWSRPAGGRDRRRDRGFATTHQGARHRITFLLLTDAGRWHGGGRAVQHRRRANRCEDARELVERIERAALWAWPPRETAHVDGWLLRAGSPGGRTRRVDLGADPGLAAGADWEDRAGGRVVCHARPAGLLPSAPSFRHRPGLTRNSRRAGYVRLPSVSVLLLDAAAVEPPAESLADRAADPTDAPGDERGVRPAGTPRRAPCPG